MITHSTVPHSVRILMSDVQKVCLMYSKSKWSCCLQLANEFLINYDLNRLMQVTLFLTALPPNHMVPSLHGRHFSPEQESE